MSRFPLGSQRAPSQTELRTPAVSAVRRRAITWVFALSLLLPASQGSAAWTSNGIQINPTVVPDEGAPVPLSLAPDGRGGVYLASGYFDTARLTRILGTGSLAPGWADNGIWYFAGGWWPYASMVMSDDAGGAFVFSGDKYCADRFRCGAFDQDFLRAHHARPDATFESWSREGMDLGSGPEPGFGDRRQTVSVASSHGSAITTWADPVGDYHYLSYGGVLRAQRVDITGALPWGSNGVVVRDTLLSLLNQTMAPDGSGGAYVFWQDDRAPGLYGQHIAANGRVLWTANGIPISLAPMTDLGPPVAVPDGSHGAIVAWSGTAGGQSGIFAARITPQGVLRSPRGQQVFRAGASHVDGLRMVPAETVGATLAWRSLTVCTPDRILAQQLDHAARPRWSEAGAVVCQAQGTRDHLAIASDLHGGVYLAWIDGRPEFSVYGAHLDRSGGRIRGWAIDGEPICARIPLVTSGGGTATVSDLALTTIEEPAEPDVSTARVVSRADPHPAERGEASAMVVWVDDRTHYPGSDWNYSSPFAMLLVPHGPAVPPTSEPQAPASLDTGPRPDAGHLEPTLAIAPSATGRVRVQLPDASDASVELFDLAGRKVWARNLGGLGPGRHDVPILAGASLPSGVYMARLVHGTQATSTRIVIFH